MSLRVTRNNLIIFKCWILEVFNPWSLIFCDCHFGLQRCSLNNMITICDHQNLNCELKPTSASHGYYRASTFHKPKGIVEGKLVCLTYIRYHQRYTNLRKLWRTSWCVSKILESIKVAQIERIIEGEVVCLMDIEEYQCSINF